MALRAHIICAFHHSLGWLEEHQVCICLCVLTWKRYRQLCHFVVCALYIVFSRLFVLPFLPSKGHRTPISHRKLQAYFIWPILSFQMMLLTKSVKSPYSSVPITQKIRVETPTRVFCRFSKSQEQ